MKMIQALLLAVTMLAGEAFATTVEMTVNGLVCGFCAQGIEKRLRKIPATADVLVSLEKRLVAISLKEGGEIGDAELTKALEDAGYAVKAIRRTDTPIEVLREQVRGAGK